MGLSYSWVVTGEYLTDAHRFYCHIVVVENSGSIYRMYVKPACFPLTKQHCM